MKRLAVFLLLMLVIPTAGWGAFAIFQTASSGLVGYGGGSNLVQRSLFATNAPTLPVSSWYTPGNGSPAVSTSDYYNLGGMAWSRPYDLDAMGSDGATVKAANGGNRYVWMLMTDHGSNWPDTNDLFAGFSNDPQVWPDPTTVRAIHSTSDYQNFVDQNAYTQNSVLAYQTPHLVYNPDWGGSDKFWIYMEGQSTSSSRQHELMLLRTTDFLTTSFIGPAIPTTNYNGWTSYGKPERTGVNTWIVYAFGHIDGTNPSPAFYKYTSADGWVWTPDYATQVADRGPYYSFGGNTYTLAIENAVGASYLSWLQVNPSTKVSLGTYTRISTAYGDNTTDSIKAYPGPQYLQEVESYSEDGVVSIYATRGFPLSNHDATNAGPYIDNHPSFYTISGSITTDVLTVTAWPGGVPPIAPGFRMLYAGKSAVIAQLTGTGGTACPHVTCNGTTGTYSMTSIGTVAGPTFTVVTNGGLWHQFIDEYYYIIDATAAANAAPLGVTASCAAGVASLQWNDILPNHTYRVYKGSTSGTQATLVGNVTGSSITDTPTANAQTWYKVVTMNGTEQKSRVVSVYCSSRTAQVNKHVNRVLNDGGTFNNLTSDIAFIASADTWLTSNNAYGYIQWWTDVRFGYKLDGSSFINKIYDFGATYMPRGGDFTPTTSNTWPSTSSNTSYSTNSFRGTTPSWINNASSAHGYWGNGRGNNIVRWKEITLLAAYQKPGTAVATFFGLGEFSGFYFQHQSGASGNIAFNFVCDKVNNTFVYNSATVPFTTATAAHVAAATFDNANLTAYLDGTAGSPVSCSASTNTAYMAVDTFLRGDFPGDSTAGGNGPVLISGSQGSVYRYTARNYGFDNNDALFTGAGLAVFNKALSQSLIQSWGTTFYN